MARIGTASGIVGWTPRRLRPFVRASALAASVLLACAVAGTAHAAAGPQAVQPTDLGTLGGDGSSAAAINDSGQVAGTSLTAEGVNHAFSWTEGGGMRDLGTLGSSSTAVAVADNGRVVGNSALGSGPAEHAFSWTGVGGIVDLGTLGGDNSQAVAVNASGQAVVGSSTTPPSGFPPCPPHAFSWTETAGMVDLGTLGAPGRCPGSGATDVNDSGEVVGSAATAAGAPHAFSWTATGGMVDLGPSSEIQSPATATAPATRWPSTTAARSSAGARRPPPSMRSRGRRGAAWWISGRSAVSAAARSR